MDPEWLTTDKKEEDRRTKQGGWRTVVAANTITEVASIISKGSAKLISVPNRSKEVDAVVLVLTETKHYDTLGSKDRGKGLPAKLRTFRNYMSYAGYAAGSGVARHVKNYTPEDFVFAQQLQVQYPKGVFFFAKSELAHTELLKAITDARSGPVAQIPPQPQPQNQKPQNKAKKVSRRKARPQEESDEELESEQSEREESDETDELESDAEEEGMDSSDVEIVVPKEEEEDSDIEIVEAPKAPNKRPSPRKKSPKRVRPASSDEEEDSDNGTPPAPAPKKLHKEDKGSGKAVSSREIKNLGTRLKSRPLADESIDIAAQYTARALAKDKARRSDWIALQENEADQKALEKQRQNIEAMSKLKAEDQERILKRMKRQDEERLEDLEDYGAEQKKLREKTQRRR